MSRDASFSLSPDGLEEVIQAMRGTIPAEYSRGCASRGYGRGETRTGAFGSIAAGWGMARSCVGFATASESLRSVSGDGNGLPTWLPMGVSAYRWPVVPRGLNRSSESAEHTCVAFLDARK